MASDETTVSQKKAGLLKHDYAEACPECGEVVFEWWDGCRECGSEEEPDTEQTTLLTDGGREGDDASQDELDEILAEEMGMDVEELREQSDSIELGDPREAEVVDE